jgi:hypothetical protein
MNYQIKVIELRARTVALKGLGPVQEYFWVPLGRQKPTVAPVVVASKMKTSGSEERPAWNSYGRRPYLSHC